MNRDESAIPITSDAAAIAAALTLLGVPMHLHPGRMVWLLVIDRDTRKIVVSKEAHRIMDVEISMEWIHPDSKPRTEPRGPFWQVRVAGLFWEHCETGSMYETHEAAQDEADRRNAQSKEST